MERIKVLIRVRPFLSSENNSNTIVTTDENNTKDIEISKLPKKFHGTFDLVLPQNSSQKEVFNFIKPAIQRIYEGFNCTILTYGQTGSGKTYTMFGGDWALNEQSLEYQNKKNFQKDNYNFILNKELIIDPFSKNNGIIPNLILSLFNKYNNSHGENDISISCSYIQIYNEHIYDLLIDQKEVLQNIAKKRKFVLTNLKKITSTEIPINQSPLKIKYDKKIGVIIENVTEIKTPSFYEMFELLRKGETNRKIRQTNKNDMSSRSHSVFIIKLHNQKNGIISKIKLCDLAGSERYDCHESYKKIHLNEMCNINKSLSILGKVIHCLGKKSKKKNNYIPYKESKLTQILEDSLGGNSTTYLIATISPSEENYEESLNTLKFADRAHEVMTKISPSKLLNNFGDKEREILKLNQEVSELKELLNIREKRGTLVPIQEELIKLKKENWKLKNFIKGNDERIFKVQKLIKENNDLKNEIKLLTSVNNIKNEGISNIPTSAFSSESNKSALRGPLINVVKIMTKKNKENYNLDNNISNNSNNSINNNDTINVIKSKNFSSNKIFPIKTNKKQTIYRNRSSLSSVGEEIVSSNNKKKAVNKNIINPYMSTCFGKPQVSSYNNLITSNSENYNTINTDKPLNKNLSYLNSIIFNKDDNILKGSITDRNKDLPKIFDNNYQKEKQKDFLEEKESNYIRCMNSMEKKSKTKTKALIDEIISGRNIPSNVRSVPKNKFNKYMGFRYININKI